MAGPVDGSGAGSRDTVSGTGSGGLVAASEDGTDRASLIRGPFMRQVTLFRQEKRAAPPFLAPEPFISPNSRLRKVYWQYPRPNSGWILGTVCQHQSLPTI